MDIVEILWTDAGTCAHEISMDEVQEHSVVEGRTVGYLVKEDEEGVTLLMTLFPVIQDAKFLWTIPKGMIKEKIILTVKERMKLGRFSSS